MDQVISERVVEGKLRRWFPLPEQRRRRVVVRLRKHMLGCRYCGDPRNGLCPLGINLEWKADIALGLREA